MNMKFKHFFIIVLAGLLLTPSQVKGAGLLKPKNGKSDSITMVSHHVNVLINNGYAKTEVDQIFFNNSDSDLEAVYTFPIPKNASMSEVSLWVDGKEQIGEVIEKQKAKQIYEEQKSNGNSSALAEKDSYRNYNLSVYPVKSGKETRVRIVYYQPIDIDLNIGRYVYQCQKGGVDEERIDFWSVDDKIEESFSFNLKLISAFPVSEIRIPDYQAKATIQKLPSNNESNIEEYQVNYTSEDGGSLSDDIVLYYKLDNPTPARVEVIPYKEIGSTTGKFMAIVTPGCSLKRIENGVDWTFVLDVSGSMSGDKLNSLANGVAKVIGKMNNQDRFRIVTFSDNAIDETNGFLQANQNNVTNSIQLVKRLTTRGGTNLFAGLELAYEGMDSDRTAGIILVTDGVTNVGKTDRKDFLNLMKKYDIRLFTFVIGNSANEPLMNKLAKESGGFAMNISNSDDITGRIMQAKVKVFNECIYNAELKIDGVKLNYLTPKKPSNLYMGQQFIAFGEYEGDGEITITFKGKIHGEYKNWKCTATLPAVAEENPEIERLFAYAAIEETMEKIRDEGESKKLVNTVKEFGTHYSLVTDYTSMIVLKKSEKEKYGITNKNCDRVKRERLASSNRAAKSYRVDSGQKTFGGNSSHGIGTGPVGPIFAFFALVMLAFVRKS